MKFSLNWIKKYVDLPSNLTPEKLSYDLTMTTVEVEEAYDLGASLQGLFVGEILSIDAHPNADKLRICSVNCGKDEPLSIVCGGINLVVGHKVVVAVPGSMVKWHGEGEPVEIKPAKLRGVMSYGMICASNEIGLAELFPAEHAEILDISAFNCKPGDKLADVLNLNDIILDIDNKSMTNRPDLWGHYGMARELAAIYGSYLKPITLAKHPTDLPCLPVDIQNSDLCPRYMGVVWSSVKTVTSPFELQSLLWRVGQRPINLTVDLTNYVMFATGQPTHAFDKSHIKDGIVVRSAYNNEKLELLDGSQLDLSVDDLVIADHEKPVALAGVMGGKHDSILTDTNEIILEIANFNALSIRRTSKRYDTRTEAATRYEKSIDPQRVDLAFTVSCEMFATYFPEAQMTAFNDVYAKPLANSTVDVTLDFLCKRLGRNVTKNEVTEKLNLLGFETKAENNTLHITAPSWRSTGDISLPDDILEEVARLMGYENFDFVAPTIKITNAINQPKYNLERGIREYLAFRCNAQEIFTYPWINDEFIRMAEIPEEDMLRLSTPPSPEEAHLRSSLIPGMISSVVSNLRYYTDFRIFELTPVFFNRNFASVSDEVEKLPEMARHLAFAFVGSNARQLFREAKGVLEQMHRATQMESLAFAQINKPSWADEAMWLNINAGKEVIGSFALMSVKVSKACGIKRSLVVLCELDVEKLTPLASRTNTFEHLPLYPTSDFDLSIVFDENVKWEDIKKQIERVEMVKDAAFIDEYRSDKVGNNKKSVTFRVWIASDKGTLTGEQIELAQKQVSKKIEKKFGGYVRI
ncbi:MAG: phenylalanine--tRNA ligase subunit beta [Synergistaceae bacterium]|nr:phenylalanine--tRNA ligase subunit beta [Synergistaceae bacterium]